MGDHEAGTYVTLATGRTLGVRPERPDGRAAMSCACGCGQTIPPRTGNQGRRYIKGHTIWTYMKPRWYVRGRDGKAYLWNRILMQNEIGRELRSDEAVHHINRNPSDDRIENLQVHAKRPTQLMVPA